MTDLACRQCSPWKEGRQQLERPMSTGLSVSVRHPTAIRRRRKRCAYASYFRPFVGRSSATKDRPSIRTQIRNPRAFCGRIQKASSSVFCPQVGPRFHRAHSRLFLEPFRDFLVCISAVCANQPIQHHTRSHNMNFSRINSLDLLTSLCD